MTTATLTANPFSISRMILVNKDNLRAMVSARVADAVFLTGIRVIEGKNGLFVAMASRKTPQGEYQDIYFPANKEKRDQLSALVLESYEKEKANSNARIAASDAEPALAGAF